MLVRITKYIKKYSAKVKIYFHTGGFVYVLKRTFKYFNYLIQRYIANKIKPYLIYYRNRYSPREKRILKIKYKLEKRLAKSINSQGILEKEEGIYIFGDFDELHDRIASESGNFNSILMQLKEAKNKNTKIKIGISRYNFFRLHKIIEFCFFLLSKKMIFRESSLNLMSVADLLENFAEYINKLRKQLARTQIELILWDRQLLELLTSVSRQANRENERQLLRLLGVISEYAFIGPMAVVLDPYHRCNSSCLHCWIHTPTVSHSQEFLDTELDFEAYKTIISDLAELFVDKIIFQGDGEPLMYNRIFEMIEYARKRNINVSFLTNGILLNKDAAKKAIELGVDEVFCSLPAGTAKTFSLVNPKQTSDIFYTILDNLKYLISLRKQMNKRKPALLMNHVIHTMNHHELMEMAKNDVAIGADIMRCYLIRLDDNVRFLQLKPEEIDIIKKSLIEVKEYLRDKTINLLDTTDFQLEHYEGKSGSWSKGVFLKEGCLVGWYFCLLPAKGDLSFCCHLRTVGNINEKSFKEIWNSREYWRWRIQAKYLKDNKDVIFLNGVKLYDEHCEHCDTHQVIRTMWCELNNYNLTKFLW